MLVPLEELPVKHRNPVHVCEVRLQHVWRGCGLSPSILRMLYTKKLQASRFEFVLDKDTALPCIKLTDEQQMSYEEQAAACHLMEETSRALVRAKTAYKWHAQFVAMHPHRMSQVKKGVTGVYQAWRTVLAGQHAVVEKAHALVSDLKRELLVNRAILSIPSFRIELCPAVDVCSQNDAYDVTKHNIRSVIQTLERYECALRSLRLEEEVEEAEGFVEYDDWDSYELCVGGKYAGKMRVH